MSLFKTRYLSSVCTATSTEPATAVTLSSVSVVVAFTQTSTDPGDEKATLSRSTLSPSAPTTADKDPPATTDGPRPTDDDTPVGFTSNTDCTRGTSHNREWLRTFFFPSPQQLTTQRRPSPYHQAQKHWPHRQQRTRKGWPQHAEENNYRPSTGNRHEVTGPMNGSKCERCQILTKNVIILTNLWIRSSIRQQSIPEMTPRLLEAVQTTGETLCWRDRHDKQSENGECGNRY